jgi:hypothetical protein
MPRLSTHTFAGAAHAIVCAAIIFAFANSRFTEAQTPPTPVTLRAVGPHLNDGVIRFIANNAEPVRLDAATFTGGERSTPKQIIT